MKTPSLTVLSSSQPNSQPRPIKHWFSCLGASFMTWQQVVTTGILVFGGCVLAITDQPMLAAMVLGAAGGFVSQPLAIATTGSRTRHSSDSSVGR